MRNYPQKTGDWIGLPLLLSLALAGYLAGQDGCVFLLFALVTLFLLYLWGLGFLRVCLAFLPGGGIEGGLRRRRYLHLLSLVGLVAGLGLYLWLSLWTLRPDLLPQREYYAFIANRRVTERLVAPELLKVERWEITGEARDVLFVHPASSGSTALVYPVKVQPRTTLRAYLAVAPEAWTEDGDGVVFSVYVEDEAGMHLVYSRYIDPKHHELDRRWVPLRLDLSPFSGELVRVIMAVSSGPAGDARYDWASWAEPRLERPVWP